MGDGDAKGAAKKSWSEGLRVFKDILLPVGAGLAGLFSLPAALGGVNTFYNALLKANLSGPAGRLCWAIMAAISASIGFVFWHARHAGGQIWEIISTAVGALFLGGAVSYAVGAWTVPANPSNGLIDSLAANIETLAREA
jgi:hypothetical protein